MRLRNCRVLDAVVNEANTTHSHIIPMAAHGHTRASHTLPAAAALSMCHSQQLDTTASGTSCTQPQGSSSQHGFGTPATAMQSKKSSRKSDRCHLGKTKRQRCRGGAHLRTETQNRYPKRGVKTANSYSGITVSRQLKTSTRSHKNCGRK